MDVWQLKLVITHVQGVALNKTPRRKIHYRHSGSELSCQIFNSLLL